MADMPDDDEPETFVQKAVKVGLIAIPLMMYASWAHKKFVPCPRVKCHQARPSLLKTSIGQRKSNNKKGKCQYVQADKQEHKKKKLGNSCKDSSSAKQVNDREICQDSKPYERNHQDQLSWLCETNEKDLEPSTDDHMDYLKRSTSDCCKPVNKNGKDANSNKTDRKQSEADPCQSNKESDTISPEAFDKLFEQHFQKCVDDFKQHKQRLEKELERLKQDCEVKLKNENPSSNKNGKYLECLTDLNLDKEFDCDPNFHSKDSDATYVVKDYNCTATKGKARKESKSDQNDLTRAGYLKCLTDLNMDKHFEEEQETRSYFEEKASKNECCPSSKVKKTDECETDSYNKTKKGDNRRTKTKDPYEQKIQQEELCENETDGSQQKPKGKLEDYNSYANFKMDDCGCDPHFNTKDTGKYGNIKGQPFENKSAREGDTDDDALKDFWHACGPPKGLRTGCQAEGCNDPCDKQNNY